MRTIYRIYLSVYKREGKFFFSNRANAELYAISCVRKIGGYYRLVEYTDNGQTKCFDEVSK